MALNKKEESYTAPAWLKEAVEATKNKIETTNKKVRIKRMNKVKRLPSNYYHNYHQPSVKDMYEMMVASVDDEV